MTEGSAAAVTTFVLVSGAYGGPVPVDGLALRGHRPLNVVLPGHATVDGQLRRAYQAPQDLPAMAVEPSPLAGITLADYAEAVADVVRRVSGFGPVILVGFSLGGATLGRVGNLVPELIDRLVYCSAFCCVDLPSVMAYLGTPEARIDAAAPVDLSAATGVGADPAKIGASRVNWRSADPGFLAAMKDTLMADGTDAELIAVLNTLWPDEALDPMTADARGDKDSWGRIPRTYLRFSRDRTIPPALQDRMIAEADALTPDNPFDVHTVRSNHVPHAGAWPQIIDILDSLARSGSAARA